MTIRGKANEWGVVPKRISEDLDDFRALGQEIINKYYDREIGEHYLVYAEGVEPLFVCNRKPVKDWLELRRPKKPQP
jgi:hypothetical protein